MERVEDVADRAGVELIPDSLNLGISRVIITLNLKAFRAIEYPG